MNTQEIISQKQEIINKYGEWTAHNLHLGEGIYTINSEDKGFKIRVDSLVRVISDLTRKHFSSLRILDLACLEGGIAIEMAKQGAVAVGIEIREANLEKAIFVKNVLGLDNLTFHLDDVRNLNIEKYGQFDVVICAGILYHLDSPDVFNLIKSISQVCRDFAIFDTHISLAQKREVTYEGEKYYGRNFIEHYEDDDPSTKKSRIWASIDNNQAFWLSEYSLFKAFYQAGFTSVYECKIPYFWGWYDRSSWVAIKGKTYEDLAIGIPTQTKVLSPAYQGMVKNIDDLQSLRAKELEQFDQ